MNRFITLSIRKQKKKYRLRAFAVLVPFFQFTLVMVLLFALKKRYPMKSIDTNIIIMLILYGLGAIVIILILYLVFCHHLIDAHKKNTFLDICGNTLVISLHSQTVIQKFKKVYYRQMYVIKLTELDRISLSKGKIVINGTIRSYSDKADRLRYSQTEKGFSFDEWWYNYNNHGIVSTIEFADCFFQTSRLLKMIRNSKALENQKLLKRKQYHQKMLELAKNRTTAKKRLRTEIFR